MRTLYNIFNLLKLGIVEFPNSIPPKAELFQRVLHKFCCIVFILFLPAAIFPQQRLGKHTVAEWRHLIDSTWGKGDATENKLKIFDAFWNTIDQKYAGFQNIEDNWQQLKSYRDTVALGVSKGRFAAIMDDLVLTLHDGHVYMSDNEIASTPPKPGVPLFYSAAVSYPSYNWDLVNHFGAALTPLPDSTLLVYSAIKNHPLGLVPGDIILGYDGQPWKDLYKKLMEVQFPIPFWFVMSGSERAGTYQLLQSAGMNWHLFDTIDIVKYESGDTLHLSTDLLLDPMPGIHVIEQLPVEGVPFPAGGSDLVSWGYINGTKIGYIYIWGWTYPSTTQDFLNVVNQLMPDSSSDALIIDIRLNEGSNGGSSDPGFMRLFNQDIEPMRWLTRASTSDHLAMVDANQTWFKLTGADKQLYDRPIAVLCGPWAISGGDMTVQSLRFHPMVRTFGLPTNGSFGNVLLNSISGIPSEWTTGYAPMVCYKPPDKNDILNHKSIPVNEEVWLTKDGVAKGEDDVVERAVEWINNLVYGHRITLNKSFCQPGAETLKISAVIENPNSHQVSSKVYIANLQGNFTDSVELHKTGGRWSGDYIVPAFEDIFNLSLSASDITDSKTWVTDNISRFTTSGPALLDSMAISFVSSSKYYKVIPFIHNQGIVSEIKNLSVQLLCNDPWITSISPNVRTLADIPSGSTKSPASSFSVKYDESQFPGYFNFKVEILSDGWTYWEDSTMAVVTGVEKEDLLPLTFMLEQNYPNPFNPTTNIRFSVPSGRDLVENGRIANRGFVSLRVYDLLGNEVATLVNEVKPAGTYEVTWNARNLSSGVYFYKLQAGSYVETKKMLMIK
jgi:hypothetical protein